MKRRRYAIIEFLLTAGAVFLQIHGRKTLRRRDGYDDPPAISATAVGAGTLYQLAFHWAYDRDCGQIRTNRYRGLAYGITAGAIRRWWFPSKEFVYSFNIGELGGMLLYRFWYGVLHPVPGERE
ncbi:hypothetical protein [Halomontanus rarus]|uniref:hypothetical protein n=1 Tax=Halomontanus rarus TaxID=3034020 RepID=UPI0023E8CC81|nr:hypothetical protein [Halovivax sp. TS33]